MPTVRVKREPSDHPRERMIQSALVLMGQNGVEATSFSQVIEHSGAPRGSIYHHFPGGKAQLVEEATRYAGDIATGVLAGGLESDDPIAALRGIVGFWRAVLHDSDFAAGCPVLAASLENRALPGAKQAASEAFHRFQDVHFQLLRRAGVPADRAKSLAAIAVSAVEGGIILARAERSNRPLERVLDELTTLFEDALADVQSKRSA